MELKLQSVISECTLVTSGYFKFFTFTEIWWLLTGWMNPWLVWMKEVKHFASGTFCRPLLVQCIWRIHALYSDVRQLFLILLLLKKRERLFTLSPSRMSHRKQTSLCKSGLGFTVQLQQAAFKQSHVTKVTLVEDLNWLILYRLSCCLSKGVIQTEIFI